MMVLRRLKTKMPEMRNLVMYIYTVYKILSFSYLGVN